MKSNGGGGLMDPAIVRPFAVRTALIAGIACAGWMLAGRPLEEKLAAQRNSLHAIEAKLSEFEQSSAGEPDYLILLDRLTAQAKLTNEFTARSGEASRLYDAFGAIATKCKVRIDRIEPRTTMKVGMPDPKPEDAVQAEILGYALDMTGTYESVSRFVDAVEQDLGATKVVSFRFAPIIKPGQQPGESGGGGLISGTMETSHVKLTVPIPGDLNKTTRLGAAGGGQ